MAIERGMGMAEEARGDTYFLPVAAVEGMSVKPGDVVRFRVVGTDKDGNIEVEYAHEGNKGSGYEDDMRKSFNEPVEPETADEY